MLNINNQGNIVSPNGATLLYGSQIIDENNVSIADENMVLGPYEILIVDEDDDDIPQSDWNQNDPTALDYVKNRPFYSELEEQVLLETQTFTFEEQNNSDGTVEYIAMFDCRLNFSDVNKLTHVTFDGIDYELPVVDITSLMGTTAQEGCYAYYIGNPIWFDLSNDNGIPFTIVYTDFTALGESAMMGIVAVSSVTTEHEVGISFITETIVKIDKKYLPFNVDEQLSLKSVPMPTLPSSGRWRDAVYGNGIFVTIAYNSSKAAYSNDGVSWHESTLPFSSYWNCLTYGDGKFIAMVYESTKAAYSIDGINWIEFTMPSTGHRSSLIYGNGRFVTVSLSSDEVLYSDDGINWLSSTMPSSDNWAALAYGKGMFVATVQGSTKAAYSTDGINWTATNIPSGGWGELAYGNGIFVAMDCWGNRKMAYSTDGIHWTAIDILFDTGALGSLVYGAGKFVSLSSKHDIAIYSDNGMNWNSSKLPDVYGGGAIAYGNNKFIALQDEGDKCLHSNDGINWYNHVNRLTNPDGIDKTDDVFDILNGQSKITGTPGQFVVIGDDGNVTTKTVPNAEEVAF